MVRTDRSGGPAIQKITLWTHRTRPAMEMTRGKCYNARSVERHMGHQPGMDKRPA